MNCITTSSKYHKMMMMMKIMSLTGNVPEDWIVDLIVPIFKQKVSKADCYNYRGITLLSCLCNHFPSTLNERLYTFCETITY